MKHKIWHFVLLVAAVVLVFALGFVRGMEIGYSDATKDCLDKMESNYIDRQFETIEDTIVIPVKPVTDTIWINDNYDSLIMELEKLNK